MKNKIFVLTHKLFPQSLPVLYTPIHIGKYFEPRNFYTLTDFTGKNISDKNKTYCELTGVYWVWKNIDDIDNVGFVHYRRYFTFHPVSKNKKYFVNSNSIIKLLNNFDFIVPKKFWWGKRNLIDKYSLGFGLKKDLDATREVILKLYPNYVQTFDYVLKTNNAFYMNMYITNKILSNNYSNWLFSILFELEKQIDLSGYSIQQSRVFGYLSEILLNVYIKHNKFRIKHMQVVNTESSYFHDFVFNFKMFLNRLIFNFSSFFK